MEQLSGLKLIAGYYWHELKQHPWYVTALLLMAPSAIFLNNFAVAYIVADVIDRLSQSGSVPLDQVWQTFGTSVLLLVGAVVLGELVLWRLILLALWKLELKVVFNLYTRCFHYLSNQSAQFHANKFGGSLVSQTNKFASSYIRFADNFMFSVMPLVWTLVFTIIILGARVPGFAIGIAVITALFIAINIFSYGKLRHLTETESEANNKLSAYIADTITNVLAVKSFGAEKRELQNFNKQNQVATSANHNVMVAHLRRDVGFGVVLVLLVAFMIMSILYGQAVLGVSIGTMILMLTYSMSLFAQLWNINSITRTYNRIYGDALPMARVLASEHLVQDPETPDKAAIKNGGIRFQHVNFTHADAKNPLFADFSLDIKPGQKIGLVGRSGSGKTTLTKLLLRFADIDEGAVTIDEQNIRQLRQAELRKHIAYVPQEPVLFHRTLRENIAYGKPDATEEEINHASRKAYAMDFIKTLPEGLDTLVGERGVKLSGGQRQRIAIARAILKDAPILLLDEATSALDSDSERLIQTALGELMKDRTSIVIAHRLSTIQKMDRIIVLENGNIIEDGSHQELLNANGAYAMMWRHQSGGFIEE